MVFDWVFERQERSGGMREKKTRRFFAMDQNRRGRLRRANVGGSDDWNLASAQKRKRTRESPSRDGSEGRRASSTRAAPRASRRVSPPLGFGRVCISSRARARAHLLLASRWFSAAFACPPPPAPRWRFPRGTTEGHFSCVAAPAARFPLPRFRAATARAGAESPRTVPSPRGTAADTRSVPESATARRGSAREGERMSGDAGNKSRETRKRVFVSRRLGVRRTASSEPATAFRSVSLGGSLEIPWGTMPKDAARVSK